MSNAKVCIGCGAEFHRPRRKNDPRLISITVWNKFKYCSRTCFPKAETYRDKMRDVAVNSEYGKWMSGKKASDECKAKISQSLFGHKRNVGKTLSIETRKKLSDANRGEKSSFWKGGSTKEGQLIRSSMEYKDWRKAVFERDGYSCVGCGTHGVKFHADHIKPFALFPELRFDLSNGRTLCVPCHMATPTYLNRWVKPSDYGDRAVVEACYPGLEIVEI